MLTDGPACAVVGAATSRGRLGLHPADSRAGRLLVVVARPHREPAALRAGAAAEPGCARGAAAAARGQRARGLTHADGRVGVGCALFAAFAVSSRAVLCCCCAGALAGLVGITVVYPLDYSRVRLVNDLRDYRGRSVLQLTASFSTSPSPLAARRSERPRYTGVVDALRQTFAHERLGWCCLPASLLRSDRSTFASVVWASQAACIAGSLCPLLAWPRIAHASLACTTICRYKWTVGSLAAMCQPDSSSARVAR